MESKKIITENLDINSNPEANELTTKSSLDSRIARESIIRTKLENNMVFITQFVIISLLGSLIVYLILK